jgi:TPR repeat protein
MTDMQEAMEIKESKVEDMEEDDDDLEEYIELFEKLRDTYDNDYNEIARFIKNKIPKAVNKLDTNKIEDLIIVAKYYEYMLNFTMAIDLYKIGMEKNDAKSFNSYGSLLLKIKKNHYYGNNNIIGAIDPSNIDINEIYKCFRKSMKLGNIDSIIHMGELLEYQEKKVQAISLYNKAIDAKNYKGYLKMARIFDGSNEDISIQYYIQAAEHGIVEAMIKLYYYYKEKEEFDNMLEYAFKASIQGDFEALELIEEYYDERNDSEELFKTLQIILSKIKPLKMSTVYSLTIQQIYNSHHFYNFKCFDVETLQIPYIFNIFKTLNVHRINKIKDTYYEALEKSRHRVFANRNIPNIIMQYITRY